MKINLNRERGNVLVVALCSIGIIGIALASFLTLAGSQNTATTRSTAWNLAIPAAEAGLEEALTQLYYNGPTNLTANNWTFTSGQYTKQRTLDASSYCIVKISTNSNPVITAQGFVKLPTSTNYISRTVQVTTVADGMFMKAMVAKGQINLNGNNIRTDSFDSTDPNYSTSGRYDGTKTKDGGDVASNSSLVNTINAGNANIHGRINTGPGGSVAVGANGAVGSTVWQNAGNHGVQPGWSADDMNVAFPEVQPPFSGGSFSPASGTVSGTNYSYVLSGGNYSMSSLSMSGQNQMYVSGTTVLWVTGNVSLAGQTAIIIAPGASLNLYVGNTTGSGVSASLGGNGIINNSNGNATNFFYHGLYSNTSLSFSGNAGFTGVIYAPDAAFSLGGGGNNTYDFVGSSVTSTVTMNGHFNFHYDEALGRIGPRRGYLITAWNEI